MPNFLEEGLFCFDDRSLPAQTSIMAEPSGINPNLILNSQELVDDILLVSSSSQPLFTPSMARSRSVTPSEILERVHDASSVFSNSPNAASVYLEEVFGQGSGSHTPPEPYPVAHSAAPSAVHTPQLSLSYSLDPSQQHQQQQLHQPTTLTDHMYHDGHLYHGSQFPASTSGLVSTESRTSPQQAFNALATASSMSSHPQAYRSVYTPANVATTPGSNSATHVLVGLGLAPAPSFVQQQVPQLSMPLAQPQLHQRIRHKASMSFTTQGAANPISNASPSIARHHRRFASAASVASPVSPLRIQASLGFPVPQVHQHHGPTHVEQCAIPSAETSYSQHEYFTGYPLQPHSSISPSIHSRCSISQSTDIDESGSSAYSPYTPHTRNGSLSAPYSSATTSFGMKAAGYSPTIAPTAIVASVPPVQTAMSIPEPAAMTRVKRADTIVVPMVPKNEDEYDEEEEEDSEDEFQLHNEEDDESGDEEYTLPDRRKRRKTVHEANGRSVKRARGASGSIVPRHPTVGGKTLPSYGYPMDMAYASASRSSSFSGPASGSGNEAKRLPSQAGANSRDNNVKIDNLPPLTKDARTCPVCSFKPSNGRYSDVKRHYASHRKEGDKCKEIWTTAECGTFEERELTQEELATWKNVAGLVDGRKKVIFTLNCCREGCKTYTRKDSAMRHWKQNHANAHREWSDDLARLVHEVIRPPPSSSAK
ncbi:hypothetical protein FRC17_006073 [Serendipita sp. 399]|nr:hypothetical protein FRC17_006073 [Serendipita sp. 399]